MAETIELKNAGAAAPALVAGQFRLLSRLGAGGMGEVFLAEQVGLERKVVLKLVHAHLFANREEAAERFAREARALAAINHPNVVQLYAYGTAEDGRPYFAMEFVDGRTLDAELRAGPLSHHRALAIAASVADAMAEAHASGIVHRDLKPANVMLTVRHGNPDFVKVLDFGIAKLADQSDKKLTMTGAFFGTPQYVAPEQATGQPVTPATDIYALGAMLFEMLTGQPVFDGDTPFQVVQKHLSAPPPVPSSIVPGIPPAVDAIVLRCLEKAPANRFASAAELATALRAAAADGTAPVVSGGTRLIPQSSRWPAARPTPHTAPAPVSPPAREVAAPAPRKPWYGRWWLRLSPIAVILAVQLFATPNGLRRWASLASALRTRLRGNVEQPPEQPPPPPPDNQPAKQETVVATRRPKPPEVRRSPPPPPTHHVASNGTAVATGVRVDTNTDDTIAGCLNRHSERAWDSYYRYLSWVSPGGPTGHERNVYGVYTLYDTTDCASTIAGLSGGAAARTGAARWVAAVEQVAKLAAAAAPYYSAEDWKDDGMAKGKAMHGPLMDAFQAFATADRALRARFDADADARDHQALAKAGDSANAETALVRLRLAARTLLHVANVPWRKLASLDRGRFEDAAEETTRAADAFTTAARAAGGPATDLASKADELLVTMRHLRRRLGPRPGWSTGDHMNLDNQLAQWMVTGSPAQLVRAYNAFVEAANGAKLADGRDVTLVHLELPAAD